VLGAMHQYLTTDCLDLGPVGRTGIVVRNAYSWVLDPRLARMRVALDGKFAGHVPLGAKKFFELELGNHHLRISMWCGIFGSANQSFAVQDGEPVEWIADIDHSSSFSRRMVSGLLHPHRAILLHEVPRQS
jgi:hypothetical protein